MLHCNIVKGKGLDKTKLKRDRKKKRA